MNLIAFNDFLLWTYVLVGSVAFIWRRLSLINISYTTSGLQLDSHKNILIKILISFKHVFRFYKILLRSFWVNTWTIDSSDMNGAKKSFPNLISVVSHNLSLISKDIFYLKILVLEVFWWVFILQRLIFSKLGPHKWCATIQDGGVPVKTEGAGLIYRWPSFLSL